MSATKSNSSTRLFSTQAVFHVFGSPFHFDFEEVVDLAYVRTRLTPEAIREAAATQGANDGQRLEARLVERAAWYLNHYDEWAGSKPVNFDVGYRGGGYSIAPHFIDGWLRFSVALMLEKPTILADAGGDTRRINACLANANPLVQPKND